MHALLFVQRHVRQPHRWTRLSAHVSRVRFRDPRDLTAKGCDLASNSFCMSYILYLI